MQKKLDMEAAESSESQDLADSIESEGKGNDHSTGTIQGKPFFLNVKVTIMAKKYAVREGNTHWNLDTYFEFLWIDIEFVGDWFDI